MPKYTTDELGISDEKNSDEEFKFNNWRIN